MLRDVHQRGWLTAKRPDTLCGRAPVRPLEAQKNFLRLLAWFMCGRAIKPVRLPRGTTELLRLRHSDYVTCDGPMAPRQCALKRT